MLSLVCDQFKVHSDALSAGFPSGKVRIKEARPDDLVGRDEVAEFIIELTRLTNY